MLDTAPDMLDDDTPPALARAIAEWFPELGGRAIAVTEEEIEKDNVPTLPLAMTALLTETAKQNPRAVSDVEITEQIIVQFWFRPERYRRADGSETPFWAYYSLPKLRNKLLGHLADWRSPRRSRLVYKRGDVDAMPWAVKVTVQFDHTFLLCPDEHAPPPLVCSSLTFMADVAPFDQPLGPPE